MSDCLFRLGVLADKRSFTVAEALDATARAVHPDPQAPEPRLVASISKVERHPVAGDFTGRRSELDDADWRVLRIVWSRMDAPEFPMPEATWLVYRCALYSSPNRPLDWDVLPLLQDPELRRAIKRAAAQLEHRAVLKQAIESGRVTLRNPLTGAEGGRGWMPVGDGWLLTQSQFKALCDLLAIEVVNVPHFVTSAQPLEVPPEMELASSVPEAQTKECEDMTSDSVAPLKKTSARKGWQDFALPYVAEVQKSGKFATAKNLYGRLATLAEEGGESPFERGTGNNRGALVVKGTGKTLALKTFQSAWGDILQAVIHSGSREN